MSACLYHSFSLSVCSLSNGRVLCVGLPFPPPLGSLLRLLLLSCCFSSDPITFIDRDLDGHDHSLFGRTASATMRPMASCMFCTIETSLPAVCWHFRRGLRRGNISSLCVRLSNNHRSNVHWQNCVSAGEKIALPLATFTWDGLSNSRALIPAPKLSAFTVVNRSILLLLHSLSLFLWPLFCLYSVGQKVSRLRLSLLCVYLFT